MPTTSSPVPGRPAKIKLTWRNHTLPLQQWARELAVMDPYSQNTSLWVSKLRARFYAAARRLQIPTDSDAGRTLPPEEVARILFGPQYRFSGPDDHGPDWFRPWRGNTDTVFEEAETALLPARDARRRHDPPEEYHLNVLSRHLQELDRLTKVWNDMGKMLRDVQDAHRTWRSTLVLMQIELQKLPGRHAPDAAHTLARPEAHGTQLVPVPSPEELTSADQPPRIHSELLQMKRGQLDQPRQRMLVDPGWTGVVWWKWADDLDFEDWAAETYSTREMASEANDWGKAGTQNGPFLRPCWDPVRTAEREDKLLMLTAEGIVPPAPAFRQSIMTGATWARDTANEFVHPLQDYYEPHLLEDAKQPIWYRSRFRSPETTARWADQALWYDVRPHPSDQIPWLQGTWRHYRQIVGDVAALQDLLCAEQGEDWRLGWLANYAEFHGPQGVLEVATIPNNPETWFPGARDPTQLEDLDGEFGYPPVYQVDWDPEVEEWFGNPRNLEPLVNVAMDAVWLIHPDNALYRFWRKVLELEENRWLYLQPMEFNLPRLWNSDPIVLAERRGTRMLWTFLRNAHLLPYPGTTPAADVPSRCDWCLDDIVAARRFPDIPYWQGDSATWFDTAGASIEEETAGLLPIRKAPMPLTMAQMEPYLNSPWWKSDEWKVSLIGNQYQRYSFNHLPPYANPCATQLQRLLWYAVAEPLPVGPVPIWLDAAHNLLLRDHHALNASMDERLFLEWLLRCGRLLATDPVWLEDCLPSIGAALYGRLARLRAFAPLNAVLSDADLTQRLLDAAKKAEQADSYVQRANVTT